MNTNSNNNTNSIILICTLLLCVCVVCVSHSEVVEAESVGLVFEEVVAEQSQHTQQQQRHQDGRRSASLVGVALWNRDLTELTNTNKWELMEMWQHYMKHFNPQDSHTRYLSSSKYPGSHTALNSLLEKPAQTSTTTQRTLVLQDYAGFSSRTVSMEMWLMLYLPRGLDVMTVNTSRYVRLKSKRTQSASPVSGNLDWAKVWMFLGECNDSVLTLRYLSSCHIDFPQLTFIFINFSLHCDITTGHPVLWHQPKCDFSAFSCVNIAVIMWSYRIWIVTSCRNSCRLLSFTPWCPPATWSKYWRSWYRTIQTEHERAQLSQFAICSCGR